MNTKPKILVLGEGMMDIYELVDVRGVSQEAPCLKVETISKEYFPGGAANVAAQLAEIGAEVSFNGDASTDLASMLWARGVKLTTESKDRREDYIRHRIVDFKTKTHLIRIDKNIKSEEQKFPIGEWDAIVIADYCHGEIDKEIAASAIETQKPVYVDTRKSTGLHMFDGARAWFPNRKERLEVREEPIALVIETLGEKGLLVEDCASRDIIPGVGTDKVLDVTGAGDVVTATFCMAELLGHSLLKSAWIANQCAGLKVQKQGTRGITEQEFQNICRAYLSK